MSFSDRQKAAVGLVIGIVCATTGFIGGYYVTQTINEVQAVQSCGAMYHPKTAKFQWIPCDPTNMTLISEEDRSWQEKQ